jgi:hypothetical protein
MKIVKTLKSVTFSCVTLMSTSTQASAGWTLSYLHYLGSFNLFLSRRLPRKSRRCRRLHEAKKIVADHKRGIHNAYFSS